MKFHFPFSSPKSHVVSQQAALKKFSEFGNRAETLPLKVRMVKVKALGALRIQLNADLKKIGRASHSERFKSELEAVCANFKVDIEAAVARGDNDAFAETLGALYRSYDGACGGLTRPT